MRYLFFRLSALCATLCTCTACQTVFSVSEDSSKHTENAILYSSETIYDEYDDADFPIIRPAYKRIAITFDDSPASTLERLISVFASFNEENPDCPAFATLFCNGIRIQGGALHTLTSAYTIGWELGNHGYTHRDFNQFSFAETQTELEKTDKLLAKIDGKTRHLFRPPFGNLNKDTQTCLQTPIVYWTIDTLDWTGKSTEEIQHKVLNDVFDGAIVLMHDGYENTVQAVKSLLPALKERGYQCLTISQMATAQGQTLRNGNGYIRIRKAKA